MFFGHDTKHTSEHLKVRQSMQLRKRQGGGPCGGSGRTFSPLGFLRAGVRDSEERCFSTCAHVVRTASLPAPFVSNADVDASTTPQKIKGFPSSGWGGSNTRASADGSLIIVFFDTIYLSPLEVLGARLCVSSRRTASRGVE